jgi:tetratricopeptide (TPR) repeat protein
MFHEFLLSVTHLQGDEYLIRTEKVEPFVPLAEERKEWAIAQWLKQTKILMNDPVLFALTGNGKTNQIPLFIPKKPQNHTNQTPQSLINLGQTLYDALFFGSIRDSWLTAQTLAQSKHSILRLRLALKHKPLLSLPWEVLHPSDTDGFHPIVTGTEVAFSRYQPYKIIKSPHLLSNPASYEPLKILIVISSPHDQEKLALKQEVQHLQAELTQESLSKGQKIELKILENPGREELTQALEQGEYQVFHYAGHSNIGNAGGNISLVNQVTGLTESLSGEDLAGLLINNGIKLAVFNSCRSADTAFAQTQEEGTDVNLAQALVKRGILAVLAMATKIPDQVALNFTRLVYRNINSGYAIDVSLSRARQGLISSYGSNQLYWALPVLYLHPDFDGILIETDEAHDQDPAWYHKLELDEPYLQQEIPIADHQVKANLEATLETSDEMMVKGILEEVRKQSPTQSPLQDQAGTRQYLTLSQITTVKSFPFLNLKKLSYKLRLILFSSIALILVGGGLWWYLQGQNQPVVNSSPSINLDDVDTSNITAIAIEKLSKGELAQGSLAVVKLLDQGLLSNAKSALIQADPAQLNDPEINYLFGRLAWQYYWQKNSDYSLDDARRYWELAIKENPDQFKVYNALGFVYYAQNDLERATESWFNALDLINSNLTNISNLDQFNTNAGLALALKKSAQNYEGKKRQDLINQSLAFRDKALKNNVMLDHEFFSKPENWLWFQSAINDWQTFLEKKASPPTN